MSFLFPFQKKFQTRGERLDQVTLGPEEAMPSVAGMLPSAHRLALSLHPSETPAQPWAQRRSREQGEGHSHRASPRPGLGLGASGEEKGELGHLRLPPELPDGPGLTLAFTAKGREYLLQDKVNPQMRGPRAARPQGQTGPEAEGTPTLSASLPRATAPKGAFLLDPHNPP